MKDARGAHRRDLTWIGVGCDPSLSKRQFTLTAMGADVSRLSEDPSAKDGRINPGAGTYAWRYLDNSILLQSAVCGQAASIRADLTSSLLKLRLYDHLRRHSTGFPSGVEWGIPLRAETPHISELAVRLDNTWRIAAVGARYLDEIFHKNINAVETDDGVWDLDSPSVAIIVLDHLAGGGSGRV